MNEDGFLGDPSGAARLKRRMIERVLMRCAGLDSDDIEPLMMLLRRFATEAAREEARMFCDDLVDSMMSGDDSIAGYADDSHAAFSATVQDNADYGGADYASADHGNWNDLSPDAGMLAEVSANDSDAYDDPLTGGAADYESFDDLASDYSNYNDERFAA